MKRTKVFALLALTLGGALSTIAGCAQIAGFPDRIAAGNESCADGVCTCDESWGECDGDLTNGCEKDLRNDKEHCARCDRSCLGGDCESGVCKADGFVESTTAQGLAIRGGKVYFIDLSTGDVLASPLARTASVTTVRANPHPGPYIGDITAGPDGVYALLFPSDSQGASELVKIDDDNVATAPFGTVVSGGHLEVGLTVTAEAAFVIDGGTFTRIDRATGARAKLSETLQGRARERAGLVYFSDFAGIYDVDAAGAKQEIFPNSGSTSCGAVPTEGGYIVHDCLTEFLLRVDTNGAVQDKIPIHAVLDFTEADGTVYLLDDDQKAVEAWDANGLRSLEKSQVFGLGDFRLVFDPSALYWSSSVGIERIVL